MKKLLIILLMTFTLNALLSAQEWTQLNSGTTNALYDVYFLNADTGFVCGKSGLVLKTSDGGLTWFSKISGTTDDLACIKFVDSKIGFASSGFTSSQNCRLIKTTDGGESWSDIQFSSTGCGGGSYFIDSMIGFYAYADSLYKPSVVAKTIDGGQNWNIVYSASGWVSFFHFVDKLNGYATVSDGTVLKTTDGGQTWNSIALPDKIWGSGVYFITKDIGFVGGAGEANGMFKTTDGGASWTSIAAMNMIFKINFASSLLGYALTVNTTGAGYLIKTVDGGDNWISESTPVENLRSMHFFGSNSGYAVGDNGIILKYSTNTATVVATEEWSAIMDNNSSNYFNHIFEKNSEGVITTTTKSWQYVYNDQSMGLITVADLNARTGSVTINGSSTGFSFQGTATILSPTTIAGDTSPYTFSTTGDANNGTATGTYTISFTNANWPSSVQGTFSSTKISGSGVTSGIDGIDNSTTAKPLILYPNPATDAFSVNGIEGTAMLIISDLNGRVLLLKEITSQESVSVSSLSNGVYLVSIKSNNITRTEKLIIQR